MIIQNPRLHQKWLVFILLLLWVYFFPRALYLLTQLTYPPTDLYYKKMPSPWFDFNVITAYAATGLAVGLTGLYYIESVIRALTSKLAAVLASVLVLFLTSFIIYLHREFSLDLGSWGFIDRKLIGETLCVYYPCGTVETLHRLFIFALKPLLLGLVLNIFYWGFRTIKLPTTPANTKY